MTLNWLWNRWSQQNIKQATNSIVRRKEKEKGKSVLLTMHKERLHQDLIVQPVAASADTQKIYEILWNFENEKINITERRRNRWNMGDW